MVRVLFFFFSPLTLWIRRRKSPLSKTNYILRTRQPEHPLVHRGRAIVPQPPTWPTPCRSQVDKYVSSMRQLVYYYYYFYLFSTWANPPVCCRSNQWGGLSQLFQQSTDKESRHRRSRNGRRWQQHSRDGTQIRWESRHTPAVCGFCDLLALVIIKKWASGPAAILSHDSSRPILFVLTFHSSFPTPKEFATSSHFCSPCICHTRGRNRKKKIFLTAFLIFAVRSHF